MTDLEALDPLAATEYDVHLLDESVRAITKRAVNPVTMEYAQRELPAIAESYRELGNVLALLREREARRAA